MLKHSHMLQLAIPPLMSIFAKTIVVAFTVVLLLFITAPVPFATPAEAVAAPTIPSYGTVSNLRYTRFLVKNAGDIGNGNVTDGVAVHVTLGAQRIGLALRHAISLSRTTPPDTVDWFTGVVRRNGVEIVNTATGPNWLSPNYRNSATQQLAFASVASILADPLVSCGDRLFSPLADVTVSGGRTTDLFLEFGVNRSAAAQAHSGGPRMCGAEEAEEGSTANGNANAQQQQQLPAYLSFEVIGQRSYESQWGEYEGARLSYVYPYPASLRNATDAQLVQAFVASPFWGGASGVKLYPQLRLPQQQGSGNYDSSMITLVGEDRSIAADSSASDSSANITTRTALLAFMTPVAPHASDNYIVLGPSTSMSVACYHGSNEGYVGSFVSSDADDDVMPPADLQRRHCGAYRTVDALHKDCDDRSDCAGFVVLRNATHDRPLCMVLRALRDLSTDDEGDDSINSALAMANHHLLYYSKPSRSFTTPPCRVRVERAGRVGIYVQQTSMASSSVAISLNGVVIGECGHAKPFANGVMGANGQCDRYVLCDVVDIPSLDSELMIRSTNVNGGIHTGGCPSALGIILEQYSYTSQTVAPEYDTSDMESRWMAESSKQPSRTLRMFVYEATQVTVEVSQAGFSCSIFEAQNPNVTCPSSAVVVSTPYACQSCGGQAGFYGGRAGYSGRAESEVAQCGAVMDFAVAMAEGAAAPASCVMPDGSMLTPAGGGGSGGSSSVNAYTGLIEVHSYHSFMAQTSGGAFLSADIRAVGLSSDYSQDYEGARVPVLPFDNDGELGQFLVARKGATADELHARLQVSDYPITTYVSNRSVVTIGQGFGKEPLELYWLDFYAVWAEESELMNDLMSPNTTYASIVDYALGDYASRSMLIEVPTFATHVKVSIAQTDFVAGYVVVEMVLLSAEGFDSKVYRCGFDKKFGYDRGLEGECNTYLDCVDSFLYHDDSAAEESYGYLQISFVNTLEARGCDFPGVVVVTYTEDLSKSDFEGCGEAEFECPGERRCIPLNNICDGIQNCKTNADEDGCDAWLKLPDEALCDVEGGAAEVIPMSSTSVNAFEECRRKAFQYDLYSFSIDDETSTCVLYTSDAHEEFVNDPDTSLCPSAPESGVTFFFRPRTLSSSGYGPVSEFVNGLPLCRSSLQCNGNGDAAWSASGEECVCECFAGFAGTGCDQKTGLATYIAILVVMKAPIQRPIFSGVVGSALVRDNRELSASCEPSTITAVGLDGSLVGIECTIASWNGLTSEVDAHYRFLRSVSGVESVNAVLSAELHPLVDHFSPRTSALASVASVVDGVCSVTMGTYLTGARCTVGRAFDRLRFSAYSDGIVTSARISITSSSASLGNGDAPTGDGQQRRVVAAGATCYPRNNQFGREAVGSDGVTTRCVQSSCELALSGAVGDVIEVSDVVVEHLTVPGDACPLEAVLFSGYAMAIPDAEVALATAEEVIVVPHNYGPFLTAGIVIFVVGCLLCWGVAVFCQYQYSADRTRVLLESGLVAGTVTSDEIDDNGYVAAEKGGADAGNASQAASNITLSEERISDLAKARLLFDIHYERSLVEGRKLRGDRWAFVLLIGGVVCALVATFLIVYWRTGEGRASNFRVLVEEYSNANCDGAVVSPAPIRVFTVRDGDYECATTQSTGEPVGLSFVAAECDGFDGDYTIRMKMGTSKIGCDNAVDVTMSSGFCQPITNLLPNTGRNTYIKVLCSTAELVEAQFNASAVLSSVIGEVMVSVAVKDPPLEANLATQSYADGVYTIGYVGSAGYRTATSTVVNVLDSQARPADFDGVYNQLRLVSQAPECAFSDASAVDCQGAAVEKAALPFMADLTQGDADFTKFFTPNLLDQPIGHILNGYGADTPLTWEAAGYAAHRYYGPMGTAFDMGLHFPKDRTSIVDEDGYTIAMYLRADETTQGFAYAVTDAFEHTFSSKVYPLHRLAEIITSGGVLDDAVWYAGTYSVYQSLYINGPGKSLVFAYAGQGLKQKIHLLEFDLSVIGMERVLNGAWHHVAIAFLVENGRARAQLTVDAESSYTKQGWSVCVDEFPEAIAALDEVAPVHDRVSDRVTKGGLVVTGYFNGGIYNLRATPSPLLNTDFLQEGTPAMRENNPFPRGGTLALGAVLLVIAVLGALFIIGSGVVAVRALHRAKMARHGLEAAALYYELMAAVVDASASGGGLSSQSDLLRSPTARGPEAMIGGSGDLRGGSGKFPSDQAPPSFSSDSAARVNIMRQQEGCDPLVVRPLRMVAALRWLGLTPESLATAIKEIQLQAPAMHRANATAAAAAAAATAGAGATKDGTMGTLLGSGGGNADMNKNNTNTLNNGANTSVANNSKANLALAGEALLLLLICAKVDDAEGEKGSAGDGTKVTVAGTAHFANAKQRRSTFTVQEWNALVDRAEEEEAEQTAAAAHKDDRSNTINTTHSDGDAEAKLCGGHDLFEDYFGVNSAADALLLSSYADGEGVGNGGDTISASADGVFGAKEESVVLGGVGESGRFYGASTTWSFATTTKASSAALIANKNRRRRAAAAEKKVGAGDVKIKMDNHGLSGVGDIIGGGGHGGQTAGANATTTAGAGVTANGAAANVKTVVDTNVKAAQVIDLRTTGLTLPSSAFLSSIAVSLVGVFQTLHVWATSIEFPVEYYDYFKDVFSFLSVDFTFTFDDLSALVTPILQLFVGLVTVCCVFYFVYDDAKRFDRVLLQYVWRRDEIEEGDAAAVEKEEEEAAMLRSPTGIRTADFGSVAAEIATAGVAVAKDTIAPNRRDGGVLARLPPHYVSALSDTHVAIEPVTKEALPIPSSRAVELFAGIVKQTALPTAAAADLSSSSDDVEMRAADGGDVRVVEGAGGDSQQQQQQSLIDYTRLGEITVSTFDGRELVVTRGEKKGQLFATTSTTMPRQVVGDDDDGTHVDNPLSILSEANRPPITSDGNPFTPRSADEEEGTCAADAEANGNTQREGRPTTITADLCPVGAHCSLHTDHPLTGQVQTNIWPFDNAPRCCLVVNGVQCGERHGMIYSCGKRYSEEMEEGGEKGATTTTRRLVVCNYALCEKHFKPTLVQKVMAIAHGMLRKFKTNGVPWALCVAVLMIANAAYTPVIKTALMILGCHPFYQCEFDHCIGDMDQKFALAALCCFAIIVFFGIGYPLTIFLSLWLRKRAMRVVFVAPEYEGRYANNTTTAVAASAGVGGGDGGQRNVANPLLKTAPSSTMMADEVPSSPKPLLASPSAANNGHSAAGTAGGGLGGLGALLFPSSSSISEAEWGRFVSTDRSAMAQQYQTVYYRWMFYPAIAILFKVLQLLPAIFIEPRTLEQRVGCAVVQLAIALFTFGTTTQLSPIVLMTLRTAEVHNLAILGLQNIALVALNDSNTDISAALLAVTFVYIILNVVVFLAVVLYPLVGSMSTNAALRKFLESHGYEFTAATSLFANPFWWGGEKRDNYYDAADVAMGEGDGGAGGGDVPVAVASSLSVAADAGKAVTMAAGDCHQEAPQQAPQQEQQQEEERVADVAAGATVFVNTEEPSPAIAPHLVMITDSHATDGDGATQRPPAAEENAATAPELGGPSPAASTVAAAEGLPKEDEAAVNVVTQQAHE